MKAPLCLITIVAAGLSVAHAGEGAVACEAKAEAKETTAKVEPVKMSRPVLVKRVAPVVEVPATAGLGKVRFKVRAVVNAEGRVLSPKVIDSAAPEFDAAIAAAVANWKFTPAMAGDTPVAMAVELPVDVDFAATQERFMARR